MRTGLRSAALAASALAVSGAAMAGDFAEKVAAGEALTLGDLFEAGGFIMWIIVVLSAAAVGTAVYLVAAVRPSAMVPPGLAARLVQLLRAREADAAAGLVTSGGSPLARIVRAGFRRVEDGPDEVARAMEAAGRRETVHLRTTVSYLSNVGSIAPMLGLLGTVIGMTYAFGAIAGESIRVVPLAAAIMKAMVTTAFGLMVGILAMALHYFFRGRLASAAAEAEVACEEIASLIGRSLRSPSDAGAPDETIRDISEVAEPVEESPEDGDTDGEDPPKEADEPDESSEKDE